MRALAKPPLVASSVVPPEDIDQSRAQPQEMTFAIPISVLGRSALPCPNCGRPARKAGFRQTSRGPAQKLYCPHCGRSGTATPLPRRQYPPTVILTAVTQYNLGSTLAETCRIIRRRFKQDVPQSTLHSWLKEFESVCTFTPLRRKFAVSEEDTLLTKVFSHRQEYRFEFHRLKLNLLAKTEFPQIRRYLWWVREHCPNNLFTSDAGSRCSQTSLTHVRLATWRRPDNNAVALAKLGLILAKRATERHPAIQRFMLANDSATIAVEVPVFLYPDEAPDLWLAAPLTGHIDVLQIRTRKLWILDYKPDARRETKAKYQTYLYARALSVRAGVPFSRIRFAYFDDKDYYEVSPAL